MTLPEYIYWAMVIGAGVVGFAGAAILFVGSIVGYVQDRRRNVTIVRGTYEGKLGFPVEFAKQQGELYDRSESKKTDRVMADLHKALDEWEPTP